MWFILNPSQWSVAGFSHYSRTQLRGKVNLGGRTCKAIVADRAETDNNADLTHNGFYLRCGHFPKDDRYISPAEAEEGVVIDGRRYKFRIFYVSPSRTASSDRR